MSGKPWFSYEMRIASIIRDSLIDYPGKIALVVFTPECNFSCPSCYASALFHSKKELNPFEFVGNWTNGVVLLGGEPTVDSGIFDFARKAKSKGLSVKLDTNGSNPEVLERLLKEKLVDYVAMDVKGPKEIYNTITRTNDSSLADKIEKSLCHVKEFPNYEFRTTVVPLLLNAHIDFLSPENIKETTRWISETTKSNKHKYFLQKFLSRPKEEMVSYELCSDYLPDNMHETPKELMQRCLLSAKEYLPHAEIR